MTTRDVGGRATYTCNSGFRLIGLSTRTCLSDGIWSGSEPICNCMFHIDDINIIINIQWFLLPQIPLQYYAPLSMILTMVLSLCRVLDMLEREHTIAVTMVTNYLALSAELVSYLVIGVEHNQHALVSI